MYNIDNTCTKYVHNVQSSKRRKIMKRFTMFALLIMVSMVLAACGPAQTAVPTVRPEPTAMPEPTASPEPVLKDIVDTAVDDGRFTTLVAAAQAAELVDTLKGEGPYTVFAPTDEAFAALPAGTLDELLMPENKQNLTDILLYHVVPGKVMSTDVTALESATTVFGEEVAIKSDMGNVYVNDAKIIITDIETSRGHPAPGRAASRRSTGNHC
jgi:transforming growth factor-beta-induced protein